MFQTEEIFGADEIFPTLRNENREKKEQAELFKLQVQADLPQMPFTES